MAVTVISFGVDDGVGGECSLVSSGGIRVVESVEGVCGEDVLDRGSRDGAAADPSGVIIPREVIEEAIVIWKTMGLQETEEGPWDLIFKWYSIECK